MKVIIDKTINGGILDIGGGGEGVIGRAYGQRVISIDNNEQELDEAGSHCFKLLMDARDLDFSDSSFDYVTFFYSLMYMDGGTQRQALAEACRVLRKGGQVLIWDAVIENACPDPFVASVDVDIRGDVLHADYGIVRENARQNADTFTAMGAECGLTLLERRTSDEGFYLEFVK